MPLIRPCQTEMTSDQTEIRPLSQLMWDHGHDQTQTICPDKFALEITSDKTILRSEATLDQTIVRSKRPMIRLNCAQNILSSEHFSLESISLVLL